MGANERRRRTRRHPAAVSEAPTEPEAPPERASKKEHYAERGLRDLVGAGRSQLGVSGALRGRDVNRPSDDDLVEAERDVVLVRRHWKPPS